MADPGRPEPVDEWRAWGALVGLFLVSAGFIASIIAPASVLPLLMAEYAIAKPAASASISAVFLAWALLQIPGGYVLDRYDNRRLVALGAVGFVLASFAGLAAGSYSAFLAARLVNGAVIVFVFVGSINVLNQVLPERRRALGISLFIASPPVGLALAQFSGPLIAEPSGWRAPLLAYTLLSMLGLVAFLAVLRRTVKPDEPVSLAEFVVALRNPSVLLVSLAGFCTYAVWTFLNTWMPTYGTEVLGLELAAAGAATALVPLAGIVSRPGGGWIADRLGGRLRPVILASFLSTTVLLVLLSRAPSPTAFAVLLALSGAAVNLAVGLYLVYVSVLADAVTQATSLSVFATSTQVGNLVAPVVGGWVIAQVSWTAGFWFAVGLAVVGLGIMVLVPASA